MERLFNVTKLRIGQMLRGDTDRMNRSTRVNWDSYNPALYFVEELNSIGEDTFATLVSVAPSNRHKKLTFRQEDVISWSQDIFDNPTSPAVFEAGKTYELVTLGTVYKIEKLLDHALKVNYVPPSEDGPEERSWEWFCSRVVKEYESW